MQKGARNNGMTPSARSTSELNNLLQIIGGTTELVGNIWDGNPNAGKYLAMLRASVERAAEITAEQVAEAGGAKAKAILRPPAAAPSAGGTAGFAVHRPRILLVDDERMTLELFQQLLVADGYEVVTAQSGFECLDHFVREDAEFDLVILDLTMPFMDGDETFRRLVEICPAAQVLLSTGFIEQERLDALFEAGLAGFIRKPLPPDELLSAVAALLTPDPDDGAGGIRAAM
jgi:CheY-like chemotaxis protein